MNTLLKLTAVLTYLFGALSAHANETLAASKACMACHQIDKKIVGPSYREVASRYADDAGAVTALIEKIMHGGRGNWGVLPMPAHPHVSAEEARTLAEWILSLKAPEPNQ